MLGTGGKKLADNPVRIAIDNQAGQPVGLSGNQTNRVGINITARGDGILQLRTEESRVDDYRGIKTPDTQSNLRLRRPRGLRQRFTVERTDRHGFAGSRRAFDSLNRAGKNPRMPLKQIFLAPFF